MKLPGGERAVIPAGKIETYCLDVGHKIGAPKARVFASALGLTLDDADVLKAALLDAARSADAVVVRKDEYGVRYRIDFPLSHAGRLRTIRSGWNIPAAGRPPYLTTAFVLRSSHG